jgi:hypothetical protein
VHHQQLHDQPPRPAHSRGSNNNSVSERRKSVSNGSKSVKDAEEKKAVEFLLTMHAPQHFVPGI